MMTRRRAQVILIGALALLVTGSAPARAQAQALRLGQAAPEITGGPWINSMPLALQGLRGRVVLVEFWTYG
jgi:hypothetical protein